MSTTAHARNIAICDGDLPFSLDAWIERVSTINLGPTAKLVALVLGNSADKAGRCNIDAVRIMARANITANTAYGRLRDLERAGLIRIARGPARAIASINLVDGGAA